MTTAIIVLVLLAAAAAALVLARRPARALPEAPREAEALEGREAGAEIEAGAETAAEAKTGAGAETATETAAEAEAVAEAGAETETLAEAGAETETVAEAGAETEAEAGSETVAETEAETETVAEAGSETETETGAEAETAPVASTEGGQAPRAASEGAPVVPPPPALRTVPLPKPKPAPAPVAPQPAIDERARMSKGLARTRKGFVARLARLFRGKPKVDEDLRDEVEEILFTADIGPSAAQKLLDRVTEELDRKEIADPDAVWATIRAGVLDTLGAPGKAPEIPADPPPYVLLAIGVNGVGKTTTLGKLAAEHARAGRKVLLVAGDTFRAAAVEQLDVWARRVGCDLHAGAEGADPSSVIFDGIMRGRKEGHDVVLCDTAGRLHTRKELMDELAKVGRAASKALRKGRDDGPEAPHDIFLVLDATIGQNALAQAKLFQETLPFTGLVITKLDGTAKGGVVLGICDTMQVPIRHIGIGEGIDDLRPFDPEAFADALLDRDRATEEG